MTATQRSLVGHQTTGPGGAVWVFTRKNGAWTQQGNKLVGAAARLGRLGKVPPSQYPPMVVRLYLVALMTTLARVRSGSSYATMGCGMSKARS